LIPSADAAEIAKRAAQINLEQLAERALAIEETTRHDVIAFLTAIEEQLGPVARHIHLGLTSSDIVDTAFALRLVRAIDLITQGAVELQKVLLERAEEHRRTAMIGRSHGIHAEPITFGLVLLVYVDELSRQRQRLAAVRERIAVGKMSGAVGTYAHLSPEVEAAALGQLGLRPEPVATQIVHRDRHAELFSVVALIGATLEKLATEIRHLQRTEVGEAQEPFGSGQKGSSAMPHKKNPILCENVTGLARLLRGYAVTALEDVTLWHQRDISHSAAERFLAPDALGVLDFMIYRTTRIIRGLVVNRDRMESNLAATHGLWASQTVLLELVRAGQARQEAYGWVQRNALKAHETGGDFLKLLLADNDVCAALDEKTIRRAFAIEHHLKHVDKIFARVKQTLT
jgi:adenylosuccinate lyase